MIDQGMFAAIVGLITLGVLVIYYLIQWGMYYADRRAAQREALGRSFTFNTIDNDAVYTYATLDRPNWTLRLVLIPIGVLLVLPLCSIPFYVSYMQYHREAERTRWREYTSPGGMFSVEFPGHPDMEKTERITASTLMYVIGCEAKDARPEMSVRYFDLPNELSRQTDPEVLLDRIVEMMIERVGGKARVQETRAMMLGVHHGRVMRLISDNKQRAEVRFYIAFDRAYIVAVGPLDDTQQDKAVDHFYRSFRFQ